MGNSMCDHVGLAGAGSGEQQKWTFSVQNSFKLLRI
jgi:hypothetical protein